MNNVEARAIGKDLNVEIETASSAAAQPAVPLPSAFRVWIVNVLPWLVEFPQPALWPVSVVSPSPQPPDPNHASCHGPERLATETSPALDFRTAVPAR